MTMTRIIAVRHGETAWNTQSRIQGHLDIELNATGQRQAQALAQALATEPIHAIYTSDLARARQTAQAIAQATGRIVQTHTGLRERHFGAFQGHTHTEIESNWPEQVPRWRGRDPHWIPLGGESLARLRERIVQTTAELAQRHPNQQIVLVAHGGVLDMLYRCATGLDVQVQRTWQLGNATVNRLIWRASGLELVQWCDTRHLENGALDELSS